MGTLSSIIGPTWPNYCSFRFWGAKWHLLSLLPQHFLPTWVLTSPPTYARPTITYMTFMYIRIWHICYIYVYDIYVIIWHCDVWQYDIVIYTYMIYASTIPLNIHWISFTQVYVTDKWHNVRRVKTVRQVMKKKPLHRSRITKVQLKGKYMWTWIQAITCFWKTCFWN